MAKLNELASDIYKYNTSMSPRQRSVFSKSHSHSTTFDGGELIPVMWDRVVPGDEKKILFSGLARMSTPIHPVMDEAFLDVWAFYVPDRLWWSHAREFYGENLDADFNSDGDYEMPTLKPNQYYVRDHASSTYPGTQSLNDYLGFPVTHSDVIDVEFDEDPDNRVSAGLHRCYHLIWNEWFRNSSIQPSLQLNKGDTVTDSEWTNVLRYIRMVNRLPDYFTTLLKEPQAGDDISLPLGDWAPVVTRNQNINVDQYEERTGLLDGVGYPIGSPIPAEASLRFANKYTDDHEWSGPATNGYLNVGAHSGRSYLDSGASGFDSSLMPVNLWADLTNATAATINNLRSAVTIQHLLELDALGGKRYQQLLFAHYGVLTPDSTLQRPELLGCCRERVGMRQVLQTSSSGDGTPQGNAAAVSVTNIANNLICDKSFTEPGFIMVLCAVRPVNTYSQGVDCLLKKLHRYDHYYPVFDNIGNQPVYKSEIYADYGQEGVDISSIGTDVFGYKEAWLEYRTKMNRVSGCMRPNVNASLASWNYSIDFDEVPTLDSKFIREDGMSINRTLAVQDHAQFLLDCYFDYLDTKCMGVHSMPGLTRL